MQCYGHFKAGDPRCAECKLAGYCKDAGDPPLSGHVAYDNVSNIEEAAASAPDESPDADESTSNSSGSEVTSGEWMALVRRILEIDDKRIRTILRLKIENPNISLSEIGAHFGITKQMVDKEIDYACHWMPELAVVLRNRPMYNRWRGIPTHSPGNRSRILRRFPEMEQLFLPIDGDTK